MFAHFRYIQNTHQDFYSKLQDQGPVEGVLESVMAHLGIGLTYPWFHVEDGYW